ncbi:MAG: DUF4231 domain-containing protein [Candidatus Gracilibacteria bacterium]
MSTTYARLNDQIKWYDTKSISNKKYFIRLKLAEIVIASSITILAGIDSPKIIIEISGALIIVLEAIQHLYQFQSNWISYRSTCENLKHEKYLWDGKAGPYTNDNEVENLLADRIESLISQENAKWIAGQGSKEKGKKE